MSAARKVQTAASEATDAARRSATPARQPGQLDVGPSTLAGQPAPAMSHPAEHGISQSETEITKCSLATKMSRAWLDLA
jgi:hypothetical protein